MKNEKTTLLNKIMAFLKDEEKEAKKENFEQAVLVDGSTVVAESFTEGSPIYIVTEDGQLPLPVGEYPLEDGRTVVVTEEGIIGQVKAKEETAPEGGDPDPDETEMAKQDEKRYEEFKAYFERYMKERQNAEIDQMIADLNAAKSELASVKSEVENLKKSGPKKEEFTAKKVVVAPVEDEQTPHFNVPKPSRQTILNKVMSQIAQG